MGNRLALREVLLIVLFIVLYRLKRKPPCELRGYWLAMVLGAYVLIAQSMVSHSAGAQDYLLPVTVNTLHLLFAGFWIGGLIALVICLLPVLLQDRQAFRENVRIAGDRSACWLRSASGWWLPRDCTAPAAR